jgi:predicted anti-sigma-YlaC factor YlaD
LGERRHTCENCRKVFGEVARQAIDEAMLQHAGPWLRWYVGEKLRAAESALAEAKAERDWFRQRMEAAALTRQELDTIGLIERDRLAARQDREKLGSLLDEPRSPCGTITRTPSHAPP